MKPKFTIEQIDSFISVNDSVRKDLMKSGTWEDVIKNKKSTDAWLDARLALMESVETDETH